MKLKFLHNTKAIFLVTVFFSIIPLIAIVSKIFLGDFAFWYDPARDLLSGLDNISKITLIGPTSGIPGVFYGPYWIWFLSIGELFSNDPRVVTFIVLTIPYFLLFPFILSRFSKVIHPIVIALLWLLFLLGFNIYFTDLWNPHLAPLLILLVIYLLFSLSHQWSVKNIILAFFAGFTMGIVMNFQLSLGIGMFLGLIVYFIGSAIIYLVKEKDKKSVITSSIGLLAVFFFGCVVSFTPSLLFEVRHQFLQTKTMLNAFLHYGGVVNLHGLTHREILEHFLASMARVLNVSEVFAGLILLGTLTWYVLRYKKRKDIIKIKEVKLLTIVGCITFGVLFIYLTAKNPIWDYHFIGVEILCLLFLGVVVSSSSFLRLMLGGWVFFLVILYAFSYFPTIEKEHKLISGSLIAKQKVVEKIIHEGGNTNYTVFVYSPSIYTFDYAYLFKWMYKKDFSYRPELIPTGKDIVFIIIPAGTIESKRDDFVGYRTPPKEYKTVNQWILTDGTEIVKRKKLSSK